MCNNIGSIHDSDSRNTRNRWLSNINQLEEPAVLDGDLGSACQLHTGIKQKPKLIFIPG